MGGPLPVPLIQLPAWAKAICDRIHGAPPASPPPPPEWGTGGSGPPGSDGNPLTQGQAIALFGLLRDQPQIPFGYAREYCFARAHEMYRILNGLGIESRKVWHFGNYVDSEGGPYDDDGRVIPEGGIRVEHPALGTIVWVYHVAPTVAVRNADGSVGRMVLDPSLFEGPATEAQWRNEQQGEYSFWEESEGAFYTPGERDDDFARTDEDLRAARQAFEEWQDGIVPETSREWEEGIIPDEGDDEESEESAEPAKTG